MVLSKQNLMKTKLSVLVVFISLWSHAQNPINHFNIGNTNVYDIMASATPINQSASGANVAWNFSGLLTIGQSSYSDVNPTAAEITAHPGTNNVILNSSTIDGVTSDTKIFYSNQSNLIKLTGVKNDGLDLNYITNNATLGTFPLTYGYNNSDPIAGTYVYGTYSGTFTGTMVTTVDAYGTVNVASGGVLTRLKTVQTLSLNYGILTNVGTAVQTSYGYYGYDSSDTVLNGSLINYFTTTNTVINVPLLSINQTTNQIERYAYSVLGTSNPAVVDNRVLIAPNPAENSLNIALPNNAKALISIMDMTGKEILTSTQSTIDIGQLQNGMYFAKISADDATYTTKFIKK